MGSVEEAKVPFPGQSEPASLITAVEWLLWEHGCGMEGDHTRGESTPEEPRVSGVLEAAPDSVSRHIIHIVRIGS